MSQQIISGSVKFTLNSLPVIGVKVEIWDNGNNLGWIAGGKTDNSGDFYCVINDPVASMLDAQPPLVLKYVVNRNGVMLATGVINTPQAPIKIVINNNAYDNVVQDNLPDPDLLSFITISGQVTDQNLHPYVGGTINICENGFRASNIIATGVTDNQGNYAVKINTKFFGNTQVLAKRSIQIQCIDPSGKILAASNNLPDWGQSMTVNLTCNIVNAVSEFDKLVGDITRIVGPVSIGGLVVDPTAGTDEIKYVAAATGNTEGTIAKVVSAYNYASIANLPADVVYSLVKIAQINTDPVMGLSLVTIKTTIVNAVLSNIIKVYDNNAIAGFMTTAQAYKVARTKAATVQGETYTLNDVLLAIFGDQQDVDNFLTVYTDDYDSPNDFWTAYANPPGSPALVKLAQLGMNLATITSFQPQTITGLIKAIGPNDISILSTWTIDTWNTFVANTCAAANLLCVPASIRGNVTAPTDQITQQAYARRLATIVQAMWPLANINAYLQGANGSQLITDPTTLQYVITFLTNNPQYDSRLVSVYDISPANQNLAGIDDITILQAGLLPFARLINVVGGNPFAVITLLTDGLSSSMDITNMGFPQFNSTYGYLFSPQSENSGSQTGGPCSAQEVPGLVPDVNVVFSKASSITNGLMAALGGMSTNVSDAYPSSLGTTQGINSSEIPITNGGISYPHASSGGWHASPHYPVPTITNAPSSLNTNFLQVAEGIPIFGTSPVSPGLTGTPTLTQLFGNLNYSLCSDCNSVYSPAAYIVDNLNYLQQNASHVYSSFIKKRPDIINISLTCDNTNTPIPYIDIVNELLELRLMQQFTSPPPLLTPNFSFTTQTKLHLQTAIDLSNQPVNNVVNANPATNPVAGSGNTSATVRTNTRISTNSVDLTAPAVAINNNMLQTSNVAQQSNAFATNAAVQNNATQARATNVAPQSQAVNVVPRQNILSAPGQQQAAVPQRAYTDSAGNYQDYMYYTYGGSTNAYNQLYQNLANAVYPQLLPFNMPLEEARTYLAHFGTSRYELMKLLRPRNQAAYTASPPASSSITDFSLYAEFLGLSQVSAEIVAGSHPFFPSQVYQFYGATSISTTFTDPLTGLPLSGNWEDLLSNRVDVLLQQTGLSYNELLQCLTTDYLNPKSPTRQITITPIAPTSGPSTGNNNTGDLSQLKLAFLASSPPDPRASFYQKLASFIRLVSTNNLSIYHWDILLRSTGIASITNATFVQIGQILTLCADLNIAPEILAFWWSSADTVHYLNYPNGTADALLSVYDGIFNSNTVVNNPATNIFLNPATLDGSTSAPVYTGNTAQIANVCGISETDVLNLLSYLSVTTTSHISLIVLSRLYILAKIAKAQSYSILDFITVLKLSNTTPAVLPVNLTTNATSATLQNYLNSLQALHDTLQAVSISRFNITEINYLVATSDPLNPCAPPQNKIQNFLEDLRNDLAHNLGYVPSPPSSPPSANDLIFNKQCNIIYQHISKEFGISVGEASVIIASIGVGPDGPNIIVNNFLDKVFVSSTFPLSEDNIAYIAAHAGTFMSPPMSPPAGDLNQQAPSFDMRIFYSCYRYLYKITYMYKKLGLRANEFSYLFTYATTNVIGFNFRAFPVSIPPAATSFSPSLTSFVDIFGNTVQMVGGTGITSFNSLYQAILRMSRMMDVINKLALPDTALGKLLDANLGIERTISTFTQLNNTNTTDPTKALVDWLNVLRQSNWTVEPDQVFGNVAVSTTTGTVNAASVTTYGTGGPSSLLNMKFQFGYVSSPPPPPTTPIYSDFTPNSYDNISLVLNGLDFINLSITIGLQPSTLYNLLIANVWLNDTRSLIIAARGKYDDSSWAQIAQPLRDTIRVKQRDALVAYSQQTPAQLYASLLIDVEMSPCMMTSRISQAMSSLQLFMDRVVLGLELDATVTTSPPILTMPIAVQDQWSGWRKWYNIWAANRQVFFYPEDWMEPELRDDMTPIFKDLIKELKQNAITADTAETAIGNYLDKLNDIARLQPVGTCDQVNLDCSITTWVFARTHGGSHTYYFRSLQNGMWTPWEEMGIQIEGDHIVPFVWNNHLCIYWLTFEEKSAPATPTMLASTSSTGTDKAPNSDWFYNDPAEFGSSTINTGGTIPSPPIQNYYKQLHVTLHWSEYKNGVWGKPNMGKEKILLKINPWLEARLYGYSTSGSFTTMCQLSENRHLSLMDLIKARIFMHPYVVPQPGTLPLPIYNSTSYDFIPGDLYLMLMFPNQYAASVNSESVEYIKCFHFPVASKVMDVPQTLGIIKRLMPVNSLYFKNQSLVSLVPGTPLKHETYSSTPVPYYLWMYWYTSDKYYDYENNASGMAWYTPPASISPANIITPTVSNYRVVVQPGFQSAHGAASTTDVSALENPFLFEDAANVFFVQKKNYAYSLLISTGSSTGISRGGSATSCISLPFDERSLSSFYPRTAGCVSASNPLAGATWSMGLGTVGTSQYVFQTFYHSHVHVFTQMLNQYGTVGLMRPDLLALPATVSPPVVQASRVSPPISDDVMDFNRIYSPNSTFVNTSALPTSLVDFSYTGAYSVYNWELFFHIPVYIAQRLSENLQFADAQKWYHYVFDPTSVTYMYQDHPGTGVQRFWKFYPFYSNANPSFTLQSMMSWLREGITGVDYPNAIAQVNASSYDPFNPYMIARIRTSSFMKNIVMKYLDNLIAWGDHLFMQDTTESINEATLLYMFASNILGAQPVATIQRAIPSPPAVSYYQMYSPPPPAANALDALGQACVYIEGFIDPGSGITSGTGPGMYGNMSYFCLPPNDKLLSYWDIVADRLYKIRHCQNIQGVFQQLPLFDAPINPAALVQAAAAGMSVNDVLDDAGGLNLPGYRFTYIVQKANEFLADVKALGGSLLSALEKSDAEALAVLRQTQEVTLLTAVLQMKQRQIDEANANLNALVKSQANAQARADYYNSRIPINDNEQHHLDSLKEQKKKQKLLMDLQEVGHALALMPQFHGQFIGGVGASFGGQHLSTALNMFTTKLSGDSAILSLDGQMFSTKGGFDRRSDDWKFQAKSAQLEVDQIGLQIIAAQKRIDIAQTDFDNQKLQIDNAQKINDFMQSKYTNQELYDWMSAQIYITYYMAFQLAYSMAKKALYCYRFEIPTSTIAASNLIQPIYWDSRRKGLEAGESLQLDIRNMEANYIQDNKRTLELTKHVSLTQLNPSQLADLRETGICTFAIPEEWYDMDYPGHALRIIKSVSISIPCVAGPYTTIPCTLSLSGSFIRNISNGIPAASLSLMTALPPCYSIATSSAQNDNGMFDFSFKDERYLPFEGAGAVSVWNIALFNTQSPASPPAFPTFDLHSISDVILHIKYTAIDTGNATNYNNRVSAVKSFMNTSQAIALSPPAPSTPTTLARIFSLNHEFPNAWFSYMNAITSGTSLSSAAMQIILGNAHFPEFASTKTVTISGILFMSRSNPAVSPLTTLIVSESHWNLGILSGGGFITDTGFTTIEYLGTTPTPDLSTHITAINPSTNPSVTLNWVFNGSGLTGALINTALEDLYMIVTYKVS